MTEPNLRLWQLDALQTFYDQGQPQDFLVSATPGAGKTTFALKLSADLKSERAIRRIVVIVPTDALRRQWADAGTQFGLELLPIALPTDYGKRGYDGYVATYHQIATGAGADMVRDLTKNSTMVVLDEIHHAGDNKSWGEGLAQAAELASYRLALTGTPWRKDRNSPIPFVQYDTEGVVKVDAQYEYGAAVADGVCRRVEFHSYDGTGRWVECGKVSEASLGADLADQDVGSVLDAVYQPTSEWIPSLLKHADAALDELRQDVPDAGGLVVAERQWHAEAYAKLLNQITGERPTLAISDNSDAKLQIDRFRNGKSKWIVAVRMVSEGVDIPRLGVGVFASKIQTPLFFRQVVGRLVRVRPREEFNARLFIPAVPALATLAHQIEEELRHQLDLTREENEKARDAVENDQQVFDLREPLSSTEAVFDRTILSGTDYSNAERAEAESECIRRGIPVTYWPSVAAMLRDFGQATKTVTVTPKPPKEPKHRQEKVLRGEVESLSRKVTYRFGHEHGHVNGALIRQFGPRNQLDIPALEQMRDYLARWLSDG